VSKSRDKIAGVTWHLDKPSYRVQLFLEHQKNSAIISSCQQKRIKNKVNKYQSNLTKGRITAEYRRFNRIRQVAPMFPSVGCVVQR